MNNIIKKVIGFLCILSCLLVAIGCDISMLNLSGGDAEGHEHHFIHVDAKAATCLTDGNIEYFQCTTCDKYYDISQIKEVTKEEADNYGNGRQY